MNDLKKTTEVQAEIAIAQKFPRDEKACLDDIIAECRINKQLREEAIYAYPKGKGEIINGPSIRLMEAIVRHWKHIETGIEEIESDDHSTLIEVYCWDRQKNNREKKRFRVQHELYTKQGTRKLTKPRDIYENNANLATRRKRACIMSIIPSYVTNLAMDACKIEISNLQERVPRMLEAFKKMQVLKEDVEKFLGHDVDVITSEEFQKLNHIYNSLKDDISKKADWFGMSSEIVKAEESLNGI